MPWLRVDLRRRCPLDDLAEVHHGDVIGDVAHDGEVVRDEQVCQPALGLQIGEQIEHLRLYRHVERAHRLITYYELRLDRERARDAYPLPLAAGQLVRVPLPEGRVESHLVEESGDSALQAVNFERLPQRFFDRHAGIERAVGILKHDLHAPPERPKPRGVEPEHVVAFE